MSSHLAAVAQWTLSSRSTVCRPARLSPFSPLQVQQHDPVFVTQDKHVAQSNVNKWINRLTVSHTLFICKTIIQMLSVRVQMLSVRFCNINICTKIWPFQNICNSNSCHDCTLAVLI